MAFIMPGSVTTRSTLRLSAHRPPGRFPGPERLPGREEGERVDKTSLPASHEVSKTALSGTRRVDLQRIQAAACVGADP